MGFDPYQDVLDFHVELAPDKIGTVPAIPRPTNTLLRWRLIREEYQELSRALLQDKLEGVADGIADLMYVLLGCAVTYGIDIRPIWEAVHAANMAKRGGPVREDGKRLKPEGWQPPDIAGILARQGSLDVLLTPVERQTCVERGIVAAIRLYRERTGRNLKEAVGVFAEASLYRVPVSEEIGDDEASVHRVDSHS